MKARAIGVGRSIAPVLIALAACRGRADHKAPLVDAGPIDAAPIDAGPIDAGLIDAGSIDAGAIDVAEDETLATLARAPIVTLTPRRDPSGRGNAFDAILSGARVCSIHVALTAEPLFYKRPLAFARLAQAINAGRSASSRVVPKAVVRRVPAADLAALAPSLRDRMSIENDGAVAVLVAAPSTDGAWAQLAGKIIDPKDSREVTTWARWAASEAPLPGEDEGLALAYAEAVVIDYLAANVSRRSFVLAGGALVLDDNDSAFPPHPEPSSLASMLRRVKEVKRFPRGLATALAKLDRAAMAKVINGDRFEGWLLTPRMLIELDERRLAVLTLLMSR